MSTSLGYNMSILYYSNFCDPSKRLLQKLAKTSLKNKIHFICIDRRIKDAQGQIWIEIENEKVILPPCVTRVPCLYNMASRQPLFEDQIYTSLAPQEQRINAAAVQGGEPECFSLNNTLSDAYSFWDQDASDLSTSGNGGMRQLRNCVPVDHEIKIQTPEENYEPDKIGKNGTPTLEEYKAQRDREVSLPAARV